MKFFNEVLQTKNILIKDSVEEQFFNAIENSIKASNNFLNQCEKDSTTSLAYLVYLAGDITRDLLMASSEKLLQEKISDFITKKNEWVLGDKNQQSCIEILNDIYPILEKMVKCPEDVSLGSELSGLNIDLQASFKILSHEKMNTVTKERDSIFAFKKDLTAKEKQELEKITEMEGGTKFLEFFVKSCLSFNPSLSTVLDNVSKQIEYIKLMQFDCAESYVNKILFTLDSKTDTEENQLKNIKEALQQMTENPEKNTVWNKLVTYKLKEKEARLNLKLGVEAELPDIANTEKCELPDKMKYGKY